MNKWGKVTFKTSSIKGLPKQIKVVVSDKRVNTGNTFQYFKTTNRDIYNQELEVYKSKGFFDVIFLNEKEETAEGSITNIFLKKNNVWFTPHTSCGILPGIYRDYFISTHTKIQETKLTLNDLLTADELILVNSVRKEIKVNQLVSGNEIVEYL